MSCASGLSSGRGARRSRRSTACLRGRAMSCSSSDRRSLMRPGSKSDPYRTLENSMAFMNALPSPQLGKAAAAVVKQKPLAGEDFYASALTPSSVGPAATDASSSGPGYGVPAPSYAPAIQLSGGYTPDYNALINNDPGLTAFRGTEKMTADQADSARRAAVRALAVQYGGLPSGLADPYGDVDAGTLDLAKSNQFSDVANLARNYAQTVEGIKRSLAARGALQSSELAYGLDQANLGRGQAEYTMGQNFANAFQ